MSTPTHGTVKVVIVDDSPFVRQLLRGILSADPLIEVVAEAEDPYDAREKIKLTNPHVITLDIEMPRMDGITFLEKIMKLRPMPVVMISTLTQKGAEATMRALELGAVDFIAKPDNPAALTSLGEELANKVKAAASARIRPVRAVPPVSAHQKSPATHHHLFREGAVVAVGASTGGVEALTEVLSGLPANFPPTLVVQHMPEHFTASLAARLDKVCAMRVSEARDGMVVQPGHIVIAPGGRQMELTGAPGNWKCHIYDGEAVSGHRPSVDVLFSSFARVARQRTVGVILTGMGRDGASGMKAMRDAGAFTIGQDEKSCVVYGMPRAAFLEGGVSRQAALTDIAGEMVKAALASPKG